MTSKIFQALSAEEINRLTNRHFGCKANQVELIQGGMFNTTYRLSLANGRNLILRVGPADLALLHFYECKAMGAERMVYPLMEQKGIPCPKIAAMDTSKIFFHRDYMFEEVLPGQPIAKASLTQQQKNELLEESGRLTALMHEIEVPVFGRAAMTTLGISYSRWGDFFCADIPLWAVKASEAHCYSVREIESVVGTFERCRALLNEVHSSRLIHMDLWENNILVAQGENGWYVSGIIDADRAAFGDPWMEFTYNWIYKDGQSFAKGYGKERPGDQEGVTRRMLYELYYRMYDSYFYAAEYPDEATFIREKEAGLEIVRQLKHR